ncbi:hypothetical protein AZI86_14340 [Bdellovibrio bacteriovorus]|uniref:Uncharacterized protein n=1 Tax=Bdellovibrio bacteriovorus TaxID=959 RepID=A0A150WK80_BDEBC|nr:hypothetical protein [Bdellovibrio bacteriovorus]KYG63985.1 hypothetical protein AZI86_14340 [Bdellovibrio bacteriovorus]
MTLTARHFKIITATAGSLILLVSFQNCGMAMQGLETGVASSRALSSVVQLTGDQCEDVLFAKFQTGYYSFLKQNCAGCHNGQHEAPGFASDNVASAFQIFKDKGYMAISNNAVGSHNPPATGSHHNGAISSLKKEWEAAQNSWLECQGGSGVDTSIVTTNKTSTNIIATKNNSSTWTSLSWNLNSDIPGNGEKFPLNISVEVQVAKVSGSEVGYAVRNPKFGVTSGSARYRVRGMFFVMNDSLMDSATVYRNINAVICPGTAINLAATGNAQLLVMSPIKNTDKFALQFAAIEKADPSEPCSTDTAGGADTTPATVSFAQLTATTGTLNVFRTQCFSCHQGSSAQGGLDLSNYNAAKGAASKILTRINDSGSPMPRAGLMSSSYRAIVEKWVTTGAPQN